MQHTATSTAAAHRWCLSITLALASLGANAATQGFGPSAYLEASDSPFAAVSFTQFYLENFEENALNTLGVSAGPGLIIIGMDPQVDSVDADDGVIDNDGSGGRSLYTNFATTSISFEFDAAALGRLPTHAGLVWTDVGQVINPAPLGFGEVIFEAFDAANQLIVSILPGTLGDGDTFGGTAEDRFFGVQHDLGIARIVMTMPNSSDWEVDHLQYGIAVPLPAAVLLMAPALLVLGYRGRREI